MEQQKRSISDYIRLIIGGMLMGSADVVPGVSGGTMAFILGFYEELINSIKAVGSADFIAAVFRFRIKDAIRIINLPFLMTIASGILIAIIAIASILEGLLETQPILVWSFFFGLVVASAVTVSRRVERWVPAVIAAFIIGIVIAFVIVGLVPLQTPESWWFLILSGAIAICAMILPGISGSFLLLLLSKYQFVLEQVNLLRQGDIGAATNLFFIAIGAGVGIVLFARVISWLFDKYYNLIIAALTGLMIGSLRKIWPWKVDTKWLEDAAGQFVLDSHGKRRVIAQESFLPSFSEVDDQLIYAIGLMLIGMIAVFLIEKLGASKNGDDK